jgi:hypothetical protein
LIDTSLPAHITGYIDASVPVYITGFADISVKSKSKSVLLHAMMAPGVRGGIAPTHS